MNHERLLPQMAGLSLIAFLLVACNILQAAPTAMPTPAFGMNEPVGGDEWRITVRSAENKGAEFEWGGRTFKSDVPNTYLLFVRITVENLNKSPVEIAYVNKRILVKDSVGDTYPWLLAGVAPALYYDSTKEDGGRGGKVLAIADLQANIEYIFAVPNDVTTLDLLWVDLPPVRLVVK
ncbi:MAG: hypothetical protein KKA73_25950 [Chloroflexi bacterium]|nr:hypothetical protein [Chloroflexota bacterium]MBU1751143.1 hypothetical protein [Chloroflexota bacterium]